MYKRFLFLFSLIVIILCGCSNNDEPFNPVATIPDLTEDGYLSEVVTDAGGVVSVTFDVNTNWRIYARDGASVNPESGGKGTNTVKITIPQNYDTQYDRMYQFELASSDGNYITGFSLLQNKAPLLELKDVVEIPQEESTSTIQVRANGLFNVSMADDAKSWLSSEIIKDAHNSYNYNLCITASQNESYIDRETILTLTLGSLEKSVKIIQKGGVLLTTSFIDNITSQSIQETGGAYVVNPLGGDYTLNVSANCSWTYEIKSANNSKVSLKEAIDNTKIFIITFTELPKDAIWEQTMIEVKFDNGDTKQIVINQDDWGITLYVYNNKSLSDEIDAVRSKLNEGYYIDNIVVNGGNIDCYAPSTVRSISISNIDNIREGFCERCDNLSSISLNNVKKIGARAFIGHKCSSITIPSSIIYIGDRAFLKTQSWYPFVTCYNPNPPTLGSHVFHNGAGDGELRIPMGSKPKYKGNSAWSNQFSSYVEF